MLTRLETAELSIPRQPEILLASRNTAADKCTGSAPTGKISTITNASEDDERSSSLGRCGTRAKITTE